MRILITGATGFVGKHLMKAVLSRQHDVCVLTRNLEKTNSIIRQEGYDDVHVIDTSASDWKIKIKDADPEVVIHLATYSTSADNEEAIEQLISSNIVFGTHLLDALKQTSIKAFINTGTFAEYAKNDGSLVPAYLYAATKTAYRSVIDYYRILRGFKVINVIPYTIYGGIDTKKKLIDYIYESIHAAEPVKMSPGEQVLDFIHVDDVVDFYVNAVESIHKIEGGSYEIHLGTGIGSTPKQIALSLEAITNLTPNIHWGGIPYRATDTMYAVSPKSEFSVIINWAPKISLQEGLSLYIKELGTN